MKYALPLAGLVALGLLSAPAIAATPTGTTTTTGSGMSMTTTTSPDTAAVEQMTANWPDKVKEAIRMTMQKYGPPSEVGMMEVMWHNEDMSNDRMSPFKHIHIFKTEVPHNFPIVHTDFMKQVINYDIPEDRVDELAAFDGSVTFNRTKGELAAMCDKEENNILALNVANDVLMGKRTAEEARAFFAETVAAAQSNGALPDYMQKLQFDLPTASTADPDTEAKMVNR
jgi:hypothetical protein